MLLNIKNVQFDTEKIQEEIVANLWDYGKHISSLKEGNGGFVTNAMIDLATLYVDSKDGYEDAEKPKTNPFAKKKQPFMGMGMGLGIPTSMPKIITITALINPFGPDDTKHEINLNKLNDSIRCFNSHEVDKYSKILKEGSHFLPSYIDNISEEAYNITKKFGKAWSIYLLSEHDIEYELTEDFYLAVLKELRNINKSLEDNTYNFGNPQLNFEIFEDVIALNLIKIIEKGTDNSSTTFTGLCQGLVIEALAYDKYRDETHIYKRFLTSYDNPSFRSYFESNKRYKSEIEERLRDRSDFRDNCIQLVDKELSTKILCTVDKRISYYNEKSMISYNQALKEENIACIEARKNFKKQSIQDIIDELDVNEFSDNSVDYGGCKPYTGDKPEFKWEKVRVFHDEGTGLHNEYFSNTLHMLIVPEGTDLSQSFKAKYI